MEWTSDTNEDTPSREAGTVETDEVSQAERDVQYHAVVEPDPLLEEVGEANEKIDHPSERRRVIPSKPC